MGESPAFKRHTEELAILRRFIGKQVSTLARDRYLFNNETDDEDEGSLELQFADGEFLTLCLAADGASVRVASEQLSISEPFDISENARCSFERVELTKYSPWSSFCGATLTLVQAVIDRWKSPPHQETLSGWVLRFDSGDFLSYYNCGDNAKILYNQGPPGFAEGDSRLEDVASLSF